MFFFCGNNLSKSEEMSKAKENYVNIACLPIERNPNSVFKQKEYEKKQKLFHLILFKGEQTTGNKSFSIFGLCCKFCQPINCQNTFIAV